MKQLLSTILLSATFLFGSLGAPPTVSAKSTTLDLDARLTVSPAYAGAIAEADYEVRSSGQRIFYAEVERLSSSMRGERVDVFLNGVRLGSAVVDRDGEVEYRVDTNRGQTVPRVSVGDTVTIRHGASTMASGQFFDDGAGGGDGTPPKAMTLNMRMSPGAAYPSARGVGEYEVDPDGDRELEIELNGVRMLRGQTLAVVVNGVQAGTMRLNNGGAGKYVVDTDRGQLVPLVSSGTTVELRFGNVVVASGRF